jgi:Ala-tRNA(Pro) deacylase
MAIPASISAFLDRHHARYSLVRHPVAYTALEEAAAAHVPGREWAKVVVCMADDRPVLAVVPAPFKVDLDRLRDAAHAHSVRLASEREFGGLYTDCEVGAMPPFGPLYSQDVFVDESLTADPDIAFSAGSHREAIRMPFGEFQRLVKPTVAAFGTGSAVAAARSERADVTDLVCGTIINRGDAWGRSEHGGHTYYFCSQRCKMEFDDNPEVYTAAQH